MKVKVKATGRIIEVKEFTDVRTGEIFYRGGPRDDIYTRDMIEPAEPDWQALHRQASIAALQGLAAESVSEKQLAVMAISAADALIEELKRRYSYENSIPSPQERVV